MDGENNEKPYEQMDDLGGKPTIFEVPSIYRIYFRSDFFHRLRFVVSPPLACPHPPVPMAAAAAPPPKRARNGTRI